MPFLYIMLHSIVPRLHFPLGFLWTVKLILGMSPTVDVCRHYVLIQLYVSLTRYSNTWDRRRHDDRIFHSSANTA